MSGAVWIRFDARAESLVLGPEQGSPVVIALAALQGVRIPPGAAGRVELWLMTGDVVVLEGSAEILACAAEVARAAMQMPEVTRSLRGLGAAPAELAAAHDLFFAPLLEARSAAVQAESEERRLAALDPAALRTGVLGALAMIAAARYPESAPDRRALEAELLDCTAPLLAAVNGAARARDTVVASSAEQHIGDWRRWMGAVQRVYDRADEAWSAIAAALIAAPAPTEAARREWWGKRLLRRRSRRESRR